MSKFTTTPMIYYGIDALKQAKTDIASFGTTAYVVTDRMMVELHQLDSLQEILGELGIKFHIFSEINSEPNAEMVMEGVAAFRTCNADFIIALGGGSVLDAAKAISMVLSFKEGESLSDYIKTEFQEKAVKVIAIPTTAGTGSEVTRFTIITDTEKNIKMLLKGDGIMPDMAIIDPQFTASMPKSVTVATGVDALCHAIESYLSIKAHPMSRQFSISAIKHIFGNLQKCIGQEVDLEARAQMSLAALEAGIAFSNSSVTLIHGMSRPIGALFHVPHGNSNALLIMNCLYYIKDLMSEKFAEIARLCGLTTAQDDKAATEAFFTYLSTFIQSLGVKTLEEYGVSKEDLLQNVDKMSADALESGSPANLGIQLSAEDIKKIYLSLYEA